VVSPPAEANAPPADRRSDPWRAHVRLTAALTLGAALFGLLATANAGGYRYGVSDQAFYVPAVELSENPALFPRDRVVLAPQMRAWAGDLVLALLARLTGRDLPVLFFGLYVVTLIALFAGGSALARALGAGWWTVAVFLSMLTFYHRIAKTGANSLEGYMHPRVLAFALGLGALGALARRRFGLALAWTAAAAIAHTTTALWFGVVLGIAALWQLPRPHRARVLAIGAAGPVVGLSAIVLSGRMTRMDDAWVAVLVDKDYLFSAHWPLYAWMLNLTSALVVILVYRRRRSAGAAVACEGGLVAGLMTLVAIFLVSVPLTEQRLALAVQLQVNRVFWVLDAMATFYLAWWLMADLGRQWSSRSRQVLIGALIAASASRGYYVLHVATGRDLFELRLPPTAWTDAMEWLRTQPASWHVLADPQHAWRYGASVRVGAARDTLVELNKDTAFAIYDRAVAIRVAERAEALARFDEFTPTEVRALARSYGLDAFVDRATRQFDLPILYKNDRFIVYDLR
jgi:hypothetical protein